MNNKKLIALIVISLNLIFSNSAYPITILFKSGEQIEGELVERTDSYVEIMHRGIPHRFYLFLIEAIDGEKISSPEEELVSKDDGFANFQKGAFYASEGNFIEAEKEFSKIPNVSSYATVYKTGLRSIDDFKNGAITEEEVKYIFKGISKYIMREDLEAISFYKKTLEINPDNVVANFLLGDVYAGMRKYEDAKGCYKRVVELEPYNSEAYYYLGVVASELGEEHDAKKYFEKAVEANPNNALALNGLAIQHATFNEYQQAISCYQKAIEINSNIAESYLGLGVVHSKLGNYDEARENYEKAKKIFEKEKNILGIVGTEEMIKELSSPDYNSSTIITVK
jgi:tetratricopeptide (TPR) repeat protein